MKALPIVLIGAIAVAVALAFGTRRGPLEFARGGARPAPAEPPITLPLPENAPPEATAIEVLAFLPPGSIEGGVPFPITPTLTVVPPQGTTATVLLTDPTFGEQIAFGDAAALAVTPPVADSLCLTAKGWKPCGFSGVTQTITA